MKRFLPYLLIASAIGLTLFGGLLHGHISQRWGPRGDLQRAAQPLDDFPDRVGDWTVRESYDLSRRVADQLQCAGYVNRKYQNQQTGETIRVAIMVGPAGPMSVHAPEVCYTAAGYGLLEDHAVIVVRDPTGADENSLFWASRFEKQDIDKTQLRVCYAWTRDGRWEAPESARLAFAGSEFLYKIQLAAILPAGSDSESHEICKSFLEDLLPVFRRHVFQR